MKRLARESLAVILTVGLIIMAVYCKKAEAEVNLETQRKIDQLVIDAKAKKYIAERKELLEVGKAAGPALVKLLDDPDINVKLRAMQALVAIDYQTIPILTKLLKDKFLSRGIRLEIIMALGETRDKRAIEPLLGAIRDKNARHRATAVKALAMIEDVIKDERVIPTLINLLKDKDEEIWVRRYAIGVLGYLKDERAIPELKKCLKDTDPKIRSYTIGALASIEDKASLPDLIGMLQDDNIEVRRTAVRVLGNLRDKKALPSLEKVVASDENIQVRKEAKHAIMKIKKPRKEIKIDPKLKAKIDGIIEKLNEGFVRPFKLGEFEALQKEMKEIAQKESATVPYLIERMEKTCESTSSMEAAGWGIMTEAGILAEVIGEPAFPELMKVIEDETRDPNLRALITQLLGGIKGPREIKPFVKILKDKEANDWVRIEAASTLGGMGDRKAIKPLTEVLQDESEVVKKSALRALAQLVGKEDRDLVPTLLLLLGDRDRDIQAGAAMVIGKIGDQRAVEPLIELLKEADWPHTRSIAYALGAIGDKRAVDPLIEAFKTKDLHCRGSIASALGNLKDKRVTHLLSGALNNPKNSFIKMKLAGALAKLGDEEAFKILLQGLEDKYPGVHSDAAIELGELGDKRAIKPLKKALEKAKFDWESQSIERAISKIESR